MLLEDLFIGFVISKLFGKGETRSPAVTFPANGQPAALPPTAPTTAPPAPTTAPPAPTTAPAPDFPAQVPVPAQAPPVPTPAPAAAPAAQPTPAPAAAPAAQPPAGFKRAIEVWQVKPSLAQQGAAAISGMGPQVGAMALSALEAQFPNGWQGMRSATPQEAATAKALLAQWKDGRVVFQGPATLPGRRAYRMTKHPAGATTAPAPAPAAAPLPAQASFPVAVPVPAQAPATPTPAPTPAPPVAPPPAPVVTRAPSGGTVTTLPEVLITADAPPAPTPAASPAPAAGPQITAVRKGEGLANVAKRLGQPATGTSATILQRANVPGPDGWFTAQALDKGGLKKKNRAGGLQPGDRLFVPPQWGPVDPARL